MKKLIISLAILSIGCTKEDDVLECGCERYTRAVYETLAPCESGKTVPTTPGCTTIEYSLPVYDVCDQDTDGVWVEYKSDKIDEVHVSFQKLIVCDDRK